MLVHPQGVEACEGEGKMLKFAPIFLLVAACAQDEAQKALKETISKKTAELKYSVKSAYITEEYDGSWSDDLMNLSGTGKILKTPEYIKQSKSDSFRIELYSNQNLFAVKLGDDLPASGGQAGKKFTTPDLVGGMEGIMCGVVRSVKLMLHEAERNSIKAKKEAGKEIDGVECEPYVFTIAGATDKLNVIIELAKRIREAKPYANGSTVKAFIDLEKSVMQYIVWKPKAESSVRRLEFSIKVELLPHVKAALDSLSGTLGSKVDDGPAQKAFLFNLEYVIDFKKLGATDVKIEIPKEAQNIIKSK